MLRPVRMGMKLFAIGISGLLSVFGSSCGKSNAEDVTKEKPTPEMALEGVDTSALTPREKKEWGSYVSEFLSPCQNVPVPIAQCVQEKRACSRCLSSAKFVLKGVKDGLTREQIDKSYKGRFDAASVKNVPIDGSPVHGPEGALITIVEFADFECPHCAEVAPAIEKVVEAHKNDVRFAFKFFPLPGHPHGEIAARAAISALAVSPVKFWEMHHTLFTNQKHLEQTDLDSYAKSAGIEVSRFHADMQANATTDRIAKDRKLGEDLKIQGTPAIFINGRQFDGRQDMNDWINEELAALKEGGATSPAVASDAGAPTKAADAGAKK
jgi:protein-disulfide isomerase